MVKVKNVKKHVYDNIEFDSGLEVTCYKLLKQHNLEFKYNECSYTLIDEFKSNVIEYKFNTHGICFESNCKKKQKISYTPDFVGENWIIETKGYANDSFPIRWKLFVRFLSISNNNKFKYLFIAKNRKEILQCIEIIKSYNNEKI